MAGYLLNPSLIPEELAAFADIFPNENYRISQNLLTQTAPRPGSVIQRRDRESLQVVEQWLMEDRFQGIRPHLMSIRKRLKEFLKADAGLEEGGIRP